MWGGRGEGGREGGRGGGREGGREEERKGETNVNLLWSPSIQNAPR